jgi:hypothetical protein
MRYLPTARRSPREPLGSWNRWSYSSAFSAARLNPRRPVCAPAWRLSFSVAPGTRSPSPCLVATSQRPLPALRGNDVPPGGAPWAGGRCAHRVPWLPKLQPSVSVHLSENEGLRKRCGHSRKTWRDCKARDSAETIDSEGAYLERETGIEPATNSLGSCDSTTELLPLGGEPRS